MRLFMTFQSGFSHVQTLSAIAVSAVLTGASLQAMPELLDQVDHEVTRQAAIKEEVNQAIWSSYFEAQGVKDYHIPEMTLLGLESSGEQVVSPLQTYCYSTSDPLASLGKCPPASQFK